MDTPASGVPAPAVVGLKRIVDVFVAVVGLLLFAAALPLLLLLIHGDSQGPTFYVQPRVGRDRRRSRAGPVSVGLDRRTADIGGRPFTIIKLRTMHVDPDDDGTNLCRLDDPRVTRVGWWLRCTHLDELPQLFNVLRGEMSLVGPRPQHPDLCRAYAAHFPDFLERTRRLKPGLTGIGQVVIGYDRSLEDVRAKLDLEAEYESRLTSVRSWIEADLEVAVLTVRDVLGGRKEPGEHAAASFARPADT